MWSAPVSSTIFHGPVQGWNARLTSRVLGGQKYWVKQTQNSRMLSFPISSSMNSSWPRLMSRLSRFATQRRLSGWFESCLFEVWRRSDAWGESRRAAMVAGGRHYIMLTATVESCRMSEWGKSLTHFTSSSATVSWHNNCLSASGSRKRGAEVEETSERREEEERS